METRILNCTSGEEIPIDFNEVKKEPSKICRSIIKLFLPLPQKSAVISGAELDADAYSDEFIARNSAYFCIECGVKIDTQRVLSFLRANVPDEHYNCFACSRNHNFTPPSGDRIKFLVGDGLECDY